MIEIFSNIEYDELFSSIEEFTEPAPATNVWQWESGLTVQWESGANVELE